MTQKAESMSVIGQYGPWASSLTRNKIPSLSFRRKEWNDLKKWHEAADARVRERLAIPDIGAAPEVTVKRQYTYDGLHIEELTWTLPYGRPTDAILAEARGCKNSLAGDSRLS